jgi:DnaK suppressor protein
VLSLLFTFRILANLRSARRWSAGHFGHAEGRFPAACQEGFMAAVTGLSGHPPTGRAGGVTGTKGQAGTADHGAVPTTARPKRAVPFRVPLTVDAADRGRGSDMAKATDTRSASTAKATTKARSAAETEKIRVALTGRRDELQSEYDTTITELTELQRDRLTDSAGDDQADTGSKTLEREQEITLANNLLERITQVERAIDRLGEGNYGYCERCGNAIPVERLAAFPSATLCVHCKQLEERR